MAKYSYLRTFRRFRQINRMILEMLRKPRHKRSLACTACQKTPYHNQLGMGQGLPRPKEKPVMKFVESSVD